MEGGYRVRQIPLLQFRMVNGKRLREVLQNPHSYAGLIVTSPRGVRALEKQRAGLGGWKEKPTFVVGPRSADDVARLGLSPEGEETGSGSDLAEYIIRRGMRGPLLFLSGNRRRDVVPERLTAAGIALEELTVYETQLRREVEVDRPEAPDWLVFFSPSGVEALEGQLQHLAQRSRFAAIGPTTAGALRGRGVEPEAVAEEPSPEALVTTIKEARG